MDIISVIVSVVFLQLERSAIIQMAAAVLVGGRSNFRLQLERTRACWSSFRQDPGQCATSLHIRESFLHSLNCSALVKE